MEALAQEAPQVNLVSQEVQAQVVCQADQEQQEQQASFSLFVYWEQSFHHLVTLKRILRLT